MKKITTLFILILSFQAYTQDQADYTFGKITQEELNLKNYKLDSTANAVILLDLGTTEFINKVDEEAGITYRRVSSSYYQKIKFFTKENFEHATYTIPLTNESNVINIKAVTHNNLDKTYLDEDLIYEERINDDKREVKFTLPNLKEGSIIEVEYTVETPIKFNLTSWVFQSDIPVKYSQFKASIPGNYVFNRKLSGFLKLKTNTSEVKRNCFIISHFERASSCEVVTYAMENIPAFIEEEYMTDKDNFISKIKFELSEYQRINGTKDKYTSTWKDVDKKFKTNENIGGQLKKYKHFEDVIPSEIKILGSDLEKAKEVFTFIRNNFNWNKEQGIFGKINVKEAFKNKVGNVGEINISLINALKSVGLNAELILISTRKNGYATKLYPVMSDFNYFIAKVIINNKTYLLDATDKLLPFGLLSYKCLNGYGRVMDFKNGSYWIDIVPESNSKRQLSSSLKLNIDGTITGKLRIANFGYEALIKRRAIENKSEDDIIAEFESLFNNLEVINYNLSSKTEIDKPIIETMEILIEGESDFTNYYINPFLSEQIKTNPFKLDNRLYPVDYGFQRKYIVNFSLEVPEGYLINSFPKPKALTLPENGGSYKLVSQKVNHTKINLNSTFKINKPIFYNTEYQTLKILYNQTINSQKIPIEIKKI